MNSIIEKYCSEDWREFIKFHSEIESYDKNDSIFTIGEETKGIYFVEKGKVKIQTKTPSGKIRIVRLAAEDDVIGHRGFGGTWKYTISAIALEPTTVIFIPTKIFNQAVKANPEFGFYMMMFFAEELRDSESLANQCPVVNLVAQVIAKNLKAFGYKTGSKALSYSLSRKDIASMVGTTYESVVRSLAELQKNGVILIDGKSIIIKSAKKLEDMTASTT